MYKYILNKINKYHQEITVDDRYWTYLKADEVQDELDDMEGDTLYLLETGADGFTEHIHKYESGCYWDCYSRILYKID